MEQKNTNCEYTIHDSFGRDHFGTMAELFARLFGTPLFLIVQTVLVFSWIIYNSTTGLPFDPYPYILLNLAFSTQAAYAAPLVLLSQTRQAQRDKEWEHSDAQHREELHNACIELINQSIEQSNQILKINQKIESLISQLHEKNTNI